MRARLINHPGDTQVQHHVTPPSCDRCACSICEELQGASAPLHIRLMPQADRSRILEETRHWVIIPTIGPLAPGHVMLVPRGHYYSVLNCPKEILLECQQLLDKCASRLYKIYRQNVLVFEHGSTSEQQKICGACIDHAHLHVVPGPLKFISSAMSGFHGWQDGSSLLDLRSYTHGYAYMLVGNPLRTPHYWVRRCSETMPSQFLRRILAGELGNHEEWDWRKQANTDIFLQTIDDWNTA